MEKLTAIELLTDVMTKNRTIESGVSFLGWLKGDYMFKAESKDIGYHDEVYFKVDKPNHNIWNFEHFCELIPVCEIREMTITTYFFDFPVSVIYWSRED